MRTRRRERAAKRREELDREYVEHFAERVRELFPNCPPGRETLIAEHACLKYSGRGGRSAAAKSLDERTVHMAVIAHIRHAETDYDALLARGFDRYDARAIVAGTVDSILTAWEGEKTI